VLVELVTTVAAVAALAATLRAYPSLGVPPPAPPPMHQDGATVAAVEFAIAFSTFTAGHLSAALGPLLAPFAPAAYYVGAAYVEAGRFSGAIINPFGVVALHVYDKDLSAVATWEEAGVKVAPYLAGLAAATAALGAAKRRRLHAAKKEA